MKGWLNFVKFPEWLIKFGVARKSKRLMRELKEHAGAHLNNGRMAVQNEYVPLLYEQIVCLLEDRDRTKYQSINEAACILMDLKINME